MGVVVTVVEVGTSSGLLTEVVVAGEGVVVVVAVTKAPQVVVTV